MWHVAGKKQYTLSRSVRCYKCVCVCVLSHIAALQTLIVTWICLKMHIEVHSLNATPHIFLIQQQKAADLGIQHGTAAHGMR